MLSLVLAASLAAAPAPRSAPSATTVVHIPQLDKLSGLQAFMSRAGTYAAMARPTTWAAEFHPFLSLDPMRAETLTAVGIDPTGSATVSFLRTGKVSCARLADPKAFQAKAATALAAGGEVKTGTSKGVTTASAPRSSGGRAGYALKGQDVCSFATLQEDDDMLKEAVKLMGKAPAPDARLGKLSGVAFVLQGAMVVGIDGTADGLQAEGTATKLPLPPFQSSGSSPYGTMAPSGLLVSRAQVASTGLSQAVGSVRWSVQQMCATCPPEQIEAMAKTVTEQLTGHIAVLVDSIQVKSSLRTPEGRFFAPRQAIVAEVKDAAKVKAALAPLAQFPGATALEDGYTLALKGGSVLVRQKGPHLVLGNDDAVVRSLLETLPEKGAKLPHAVDFSVDPKKVARGLSQVSLMDVMSNQQLAALFAASAEVGPLLSNSERITGWLDSASGGAHRFSLNWALPPAAGKSSP
ncbi:hypothetical protein [Hyalangium rubrum]|uniref:DUF3352 domain-containing protein n=1 Tax=Hyalangium rubrum TaxID=3103134 RepID=A0ABU5H088_9BACT|nr:hypothetical protein [Hyalangium sp. s54d21]MDY7226849.1 hypothetical protein [Hyalangium sp. s54d21]